MAAAQGQVILPTQSENELLARLRPGEQDIPSSSSASMFAEFIAAQQKQGKDVKVNPNALIESPLSLPAKVKNEIFDRAVESWHSKQATSNKG